MLGTPNGDLGPSNQNAKQPPNEALEEVEEQEKISKDIYHTAIVIFCICATTYP